MPRAHDIQKQAPSNNLPVAMVPRHRPAVCPSFPPPPRLAQLGIRERASVRGDDRGGLGPRDAAGTATSSSSSSTAAPEATAARRIAVVFAPLLDIYADKRAIDR